MSSSIDISRHKDLFDASLFKKPVTIIGAGATGSWLTMILAKLGIDDITVYDYDTVDEHNVANQLYGLPDVGFSKVTTLQGEVEHTTGTIIKARNRKFDDERLVGIVFLMVDSMSERKRIWENCIKLKPYVDLLIEPRMGLDLSRLYCVNPCNLDHIRKYEATYYGDEEAEVSYCGSALSVVTTAVATASWCARQLINNHCEVHVDNEIYIDFKFNNVITTVW